MAATTFVRQLPASRPSVCDVFGSLYALRFLIHSRYVLVLLCEFYHYYHYCYC